MKPKKLPSGTWRVLVYLGEDENGKKIVKSLTAASKNEVMYLAQKYKKDYAEGKLKQVEPITVRDACIKYIEKVRNYNRASTIYGYEKIVQYRFRQLMDKNLSDLNEEIIQNAINEECNSLTQYGKAPSPKTISNAWMLLRTVLSEHGFNFTPRLPRIEPIRKELPEPSEIIQAVKGTDIELPCILSMWLGLRLGELLGINCSAIRNGTLHIEGTKLRIGSTIEERTSAKTDVSLRDAPLPTSILSLIESQPSYIEYLASGTDGPLIELTGSQIEKRWKKVRDLHGWQITFHNLRSEAASIMLYLGVTDRYSAERLGWKVNSTVMKEKYQRVYSNEMNRVNQLVNDYFESIQSD